MRLAACGEKAIPASSEITTACEQSKIKPRESRTGFREIKALFEQIGHESKQGDKSTKSSTNDVEVGDCKCRHGQPGGYKL